MSLDSMHETESRSTLVRSSKPTFALTSHSQESIRYGDVIYLSHRTFGAAKIELVSSYITSITHSIVTSTEYSYDPSAINPIPNLHRCAFRVLAPNKSQAQDELAHLRGLLARKMRPSHEEESKLLALKKALSVEKKDNISEQKRLTGRDMVYGDTFQLQHLLSGMYLGVSDSETSVVDRSCLKVTLFENNGTHVHFRIVPKYKVRNIGDKIRIEDQIILENLRSQQYLHVSSSKIEDSFFGLEEETYEVNASALDSPMTIYSHIVYSSEAETARCIRGGSVLRLYHLQDQCYLVAPGLVKQKKIDDVHLRRRKLIFGNLKEPSTSAITYWQIEVADCPLSGDSIKWGSKIRIKHMLTQYYLSINEATADKVIKDVSLITLSKDPTGLLTTFILRPFIDEGKELIEFESYARMYHPHSECWLRASDQLYNSVATESGPFAMLGFRWDNADTFMIMAERARGYHDAFTLELVDDALVKHFYYASGFLTVVKVYLETYGKEVKQNSRAMDQALTQLVDWMLTNPKETKIRQKLLRNLGLIDLLMEVQERFTEVNRDQMTPYLYGKLKATTKKIYDLVAAYLTGDSRKNENYCAKFIPTFESHFDRDIDAEVTLIELVRDNRAIISYFSQNVVKITELFAKLVETNNHQLFYYFGVLCVANNSPIPENQILLAKQLDSTLSEGAIFRMRLEENVIITMSPFPEQRGEKTWKPLSSYVHESSTSIDSPPFHYLLGQLEFFINLCHGNNTKTIRILENSFPFDVVYSGLIDASIHPLIRSKFAELIGVMFVDVGENRAVLEDLTLTFIYNDCIQDPDKDAADDPAIALSGVKNIHFPILRQWFLDFLEEFRIHGREDYIHYNEFTAKVLDIIILFVKFGFYDDHDDANDLINLSIKLANGANDRYQPENISDDPLAKNPVQMDFATTGRYEDRKTNRPIFDIKIKALQIIELFMNFRFFKRLQRCIFFYRVINREIEYTEDRQRILQDLHLQLQVNPLEVLRRNIEHLHNPDYALLRNDTLKQNAKAHLENDLLGFATYRFEHPTSGINFESILLDLTLYKCPELLSTALRLLDNQYTVEKHLFEKAIQTQVLINDKSITLYNDIDKILPNFRRLINASFQKSDSCRQLIEILDNFRSACSLSEECSEPHPQNQKILYNFGILADLLNLLSRTQEALPPTSSSAAFEEIDQNASSKVSRSTLLLLRKMAQSNIEVQRRIYDRLKLLVTNELFDLASSELCELLAEVFTGAQDIVMNIKSEDIDSLCGLIRKRGDVYNIDVIPGVIYCLKAVTKVEELDLPLHSNQVNIMNNFMSGKEKPIDDIIGTELAKSKHRKHLLSLNLETANEEEVAHMNLMLSVYDLMASLCEGENLHHESVCQSMITIDELLDILNQEELPYARKHQFASFFNWVYLNTQRTSSSFETFSSDNPLFWKFLSDAITFVKGVLAVLQRRRASEMPPITTNSTLRQRTDKAQLGDVSQKGEASQEAAKPFTSSESRLGSIEEIDGSVTDYLFNGLLPIIFTFFTRYFTAQKSEDHIASTVDTIDISMELCSLLMELSISLQPLLTSAYNAKSLYKATLAILTHEEIRNLQEDVFLGYIKRSQLLQFHSLFMEADNFKCELTKGYFIEYSAEISLNDNFNSFVNNLRKAYSGANLALEQIGANNDQPYSTYLDTLCIIDAPDSLPLGNSFQKHLVYFFKHTEHKCKVTKYARGLVLQLMHSYSNFYNLNEKAKLRQEKLDIKCIQLLRAAIHNELLYIDPNIKENNPTQYRKELESKVEKLQNAIQNLNDTSINSIILIGHPSKKVADQAIALLRELLFGGNKYIQTKIEILGDTREEKFFQQMDSILFYGTNSLREAKSLEVQLLARQSKRSEMKNYLIDIFNLVEQGAVDNAEPRTPQLADTLTFSEVEVSAEDNNPLFGKYKPSSMESPSGIQMQYLSKPTTKAFPIQDTTTNVALQTTGGADDGLGPASRYALIKPSSGEQQQQQQPDSGDLIKEQIHDVTFRKNLRTIEVALNVMGLMCDGQQLFLQNYFREQPDNPENINMIVKIIHFLDVFYTEINSENISLVAEVFSTLIEFISGNYENQNDAFGSKVMDSINRIFQTPNFYNCSLEQILSLYDAIVKFLQLIIEETNLKTRILAYDIYEAVDVSCFHQIISLLYEMKLDSMNSDDVRKLAEEIMFRLYHFLLHLRDFDSVLQEEQQKIIPQEGISNELVLSAWNFCAQRSKSVEIVFVNSDNEHILNKLHFRSSESSAIQEQVREIVKWNVNRDSAEDKVRDFIDWFTAVKIDQSYSYWLRTTLLISLYIKYPNTRKYLFLLWTIICNLFILSTWTTPCIQVVKDADEPIYTCIGNNSDMASRPQLPIVPIWYDYVFYILAAIHLISALDIFVLFFVTNGVNFYIPRILYRIIPEGYDKRNYRIKWKAAPPSRFLEINIFGSSVIFNYIILLSSIVSIPFRGYFWPISLLYILERSDILRRVLRSVTQNGKSLILVAVFGVIVIYIFSVIGFALFYQQAESTIPGGERYVFCHTLFECAVSFARYGLLETIGVALPHRTAQFGYEIDRIIYDLLFFIIVTTIGLNIVFGIIVDTFSELRDEKYTQEKDMKSVCFICGIENFLLDRKGSGFKHHVKNEHNMWDYMSFFLYLDNVDPSDHTATESFVFEKLKNLETSFFPHNQARCLRDDEDTSAQEFAQLYAYLDEANTNIKELLTKVRKLEKSQNVSNDY